MRKNGFIIQCEVCGKDRYVQPSLVKMGRGRFCSMSCKSKVAVRAMLSVRGESWRRNVQKAAKRRIGADETEHWKWSGDSVGYYGVHDWITKHFGQPIGCEKCGLIDPNRKYHWANISHTYKRRRDDFMRLCVSCHRKYDYASRRTA